MYNGGIGGGVNPLCLFGLETGAGVGLQEGIETSCQKCCLGTKNDDNKQTLTPSSIISFTFH